jgi:hypothetical protein
MLRVKYISLFAVLTFLLTSTTCAQSETQNENYVSDHLAGQFICLLHNNAEVNKVISQLNSNSQFDFTATKRLSKSMNVWLFNFMPDSNENQAKLALERHKDIQLAQFNHTNLSVRDTPNDTLFYRQWSFLNDGTNGGSGLADISAKSAWDITTGGTTSIGDTIVVAVIDQGFDVDHVDLIDNMFINHGEIHGNNIDDDGNGYVDDRQGWDFYNDDPFHPNNNHGTHVSGTVGASGNNQIGVTGINWNVKILPITGSSTLESTVVEAYAYVLELRRMYNETNGEKGAYVVATNSSFGVDEGQPFDYPIWCAMYDSLGYAGVLSAGATANDNVNIDDVGDVPTACGSNFLISVTNMRSTDEINGNAGFGFESIDLGAPGTGIYSTFSNNNYGNNTGTSMATPHVAGALGLMYSAVCPSIYEEFGVNYSGLALFVKDKLLDDGVDQLNSMAGLVKTGGRLNLDKAIKSVSNLCFQLLFDVDSSTCGNCNGAIQASTLGNNGAVSYLWNTGATADSITGLCAGIYTVTVIDGSDTLIKSVALSDDDGVVLSINKSNISCFGQNDGSIIVSGGFNYEWSDGSSNTQRSGLEKGEYSLTATDSLANCTTTAIILLTEPDLLEATYQFQMPSTSGGFDGNLTATAIGGIMPYSYQWSTGDTINSITNSISKYSLTITDANGCQFTDSAFLGYPLSIHEANERKRTIKVWPNPVSTRVNIEANWDFSSVQIIDALGHLVFNNQYQVSRSVSISTANFASGVYTLFLKDQDSEYHTKLIVTNE